MEIKSVELHKEQGGIHSEHSIPRVIQGNTYKDLSTIIVIPTRGIVHAKAVSSWWALIQPMNQKCTKVFAVGMEVGEAYNNMIEQILANEELSKWKYILTLEEDNLPPPDGLLRLYENAEEYDVIGGLYWTKGEEGQPMIYGEGKEGDLHFRPQPPSKDIQECDGLGMGFTLFKTKIFKDERIEKPWFKTCQEFSPEKGAKMYTQDLYFFEHIRKLGYKVACDTRVKVGHLDVNTDIVW
ncbi:MAG: hypothetical protein LiPW41_807 [Parcubacteria group bacterium LiPW_41]|nr:MAG: hypothetical protein LiPW41_807 [Parcubacteria group bacterium LiPW_41]